MAGLTPGQQGARSTGGAAAAPRPDWHAQPAAMVVAALGSDAERGLSATVAAERRAAVGPNRLTTRPSTPAIVRFLGQFNDLLIWLLLGAVVVALLLGEWLDAGAILAIVLLNAVLGFSQEQRAEAALAALQQLTTPQARVVRDGELGLQPAVALVPGDVIELESGDRVPADARLLVGYALTIDEAPLTGESLPVDKAANQSLPVETPLAERLTMVYSGTSVTAGHARAVVVATGMQTELGQLAGLVETAGLEETPLQRRLTAVGRWLVYAALIIGALVFALGLWRGIPASEMFLTAVSLAVAAVPEGLPAVVTIVLALGTQRMARRRAIVRRLPAVEALGGTTIICTDKTGTLTQNRMVVRTLWTPATAPRNLGEGGPIAPAERALLRGAVLASTARLGAGAAGSDGPVALGDPTETALLLAAAAAGLALEPADYGLRLIDELPFDSDRKRLTRLFRPLAADDRPSEPGATIAYIKGAPDQILTRSSRQLGPDGERPLGERERQAARAVNDQLADAGLRVLAVAVRPASPTGDAETVEAELTLLGLIGLYDPPRAEVAAAVAECRAAGIRAVMITGDQLRTGRAIGRELGLIRANDRVVTGNELDDLPEEQLRMLVPQVSAYARVTGEHKLRIVRAWRARGEVVAMTGDGVNDAPAVRAADVGVAMGITGTDVTREAADLVLADDNFATIVAAVEEGRVIADNIRKVLRYLLSCNAAEILVMLGAVLLGLPLPLLAVQILWMNLVTDSLPALALGTEPAERAVMRRRPERPGGPLLRSAAIRDLLIEAAVMSGLALIAFALGLGLGRSEEVARTIAFTTLVLTQLWQALNCRSETSPLTQLGLLSNPRLVAAVLIAAGLQLAILYVPVAATIFRVAPLAALDLVLCLLLAMLVWPAVELRKRLVPHLPWLG